MSPNREFRIGEFCKMVGLPKSRVRFYEKHGLLAGQLGPNGYRYYTSHDAFRVNAFLNLLQYGFTVEKAIRILDEEQGCQEFAVSLKEQACWLDRQVALFHHRRCRIETTLGLLRQAGQPGFLHRDVEDYLYVQASEGADFGPSERNARAIKAFYSVLEVSRCARLIRRDDLLAPGDHVQPSYVIVVPRLAAQQMGVADLPSVKTLSMGSCVVFCRTKTRNESLLRESFEPLMAHLKAHDLTVRDDVLLLPTFLNLDGQGTDVEELLVPVKPAVGPTY